MIPNAPSDNCVAYAAQKRLWTIVIPGFLVLVGALAACADEGTGGTTAPPATEAPGEQALEDGDYFAFVTVGEDESEEIVLGVDLAEMLTGEEARQAAIEEGFIEEDEELDTDFYISNPEQVMELVPLDPAAEITVISGTDTSQEIAIDAATLQAIYDGTYTGDPVYGIVAGQPIVMDVVIEGGLVTEAHAVYLP